MPKQIETAFGLYEVTEVLGEGGAGKVYLGIGPDGTEVAIKVLSADRVSADKRRRFKNEIFFLSRNRHPNIVTVLDHGVIREETGSQPFYVMPRYASSLRAVMKEGIPSNQVLPIFSQILDGVEAAHLQNVVHRDLKPENVLFDPNGSKVAISDFGAARFTEDLMLTIVETAPHQRLANFQYAAPEQRVAGG